MRAGRSKGLCNAVGAALVVAARHDGTSAEGFYSREDAFVVGSHIDLLKYRGSLFVAENPYTHQTGQYPRTAVALTEGGHLLLVVCDGRYASGFGGNGMSAYWLTVFLATHFNPQYAINLDGGGSSTMCVQNRGDEDTHVVNYPCDNMGDDSKNHDHAGERARDSFIVIVPKSI